MESSPLLKRSNKIYSGSGNLFLIGEEKCEVPDHIDGFILHEKPSTMRIFNRDGSEAEMCGNGLRCFIQYLIDQGSKESRFSVKTRSGTLYGWEEKGEICVTLPPPSPPKKIVADGIPFILINTGVPHAVCTDLNALSKHFVHHRAFGPKGANITHYQVKGDLLKVRTFERGVNRETESCGTGSCAAAIVSNLPSPITVEARSKEKLTVTLSPLTLRGSVSILQQQ
ncbi:MAG: Diaminopimelate epimerase [Chlamydiales bacterium]|nr:Diaminopimelate epimerase [Chlamydiales bacterium]